MRCRLLVLLGVLALVSCKEDSKPGAPASFPGAGGSAGASAGGSAGSTSDASAGQAGSTAGGDSGGGAGEAGASGSAGDAGPNADADTDADAQANADAPSDASVPDSDDGAVQPDGPQDAAEEYALLDGPEKETGPNLACEQPQSWWFSSAQFDKSITPVAFADALTSLATSVPQHWLTFAEKLDGAAWSITASGTVDNGAYQQHFPGEYYPTMTGLVRATNKFSTAAPQAQGWMRVVDSAPSDVWISLVNIETSAEYDDPSCQTLKAGVLTAVIPQSQGTVAIKTTTQTTLGALLGTPNSASPSGWTVKLTYSAEHVEVSWK